MFNVCCVMTSFCCHLCCSFCVSEPGASYAFEGQEEDDSWDVLWAFGGREPTEGHSLVAFWDPDNHLLQEWLSTVMRRKGVKNPLPSTPTPNMWQWERFILYLTCRCLSDLSHQQLGVAFIWRKMRSPTLLEVSWGALSSLFNPTDECIFV